MGSLRLRWGGQVSNHSNEGTQATRAKEEGFSHRTPGSRDRIRPAGGNQLGMTVGQLNDEVGFATILSFSGDFQALAVERMMRGSNSDVL